MQLLLSLVSILPAVNAFTYTVGVGKDETTGKVGIGFDPSEIYPALGDMIIFEFRAGSHSVVQTSFENPCTSNGGFNTGVKTVPDNTPVDASDLPTVSYSISDTSAPIWFFDEAGGLCTKGAVLAINAPHSGDQTAAAFKERAKTATPGPPSNSTNSASASSSPSATSSGSGSAAQPSQTGSASTESRLSAAGLGLVASAVFLFLS